MRFDLLLLSVLIIRYASCWQHHSLRLPLAERIMEGECAQRDEGVENYFPEEFQVKVREGEEGADFFDVYYAATFKVVVSRLAQEHYVLTQCGLDRPSDEQVNAVVALEDGYSRKHFDIPLVFAAAEETVHLGFLAELDMYERVGHFTQYAVDACWLKLLECEPDVTIGSEITEGQLENVDAAFVSSVTKANSTPKAIHVPATQDPHPLKSAEYIKFMSVFFNLEKRANRLFDLVEANYRAVGSSPEVEVKSFSHLRPIGGKTVAEPHKVAWISMNDHARELVISMADFKKAMVEDVGAVMPDPARVEITSPGYEIRDNGANHVIKLDVENRSHALLGDILHDLEIDVVIDETYQPDPSQLTYEDWLASFRWQNRTDLAFLNNMMVLRKDSIVANNSNSLAWFESRVARPDIAVEGLYECMTDACSGWKYFRNLALGSRLHISDASDCHEYLPICTGNPLQILHMLTHDDTPPAQKSPQTRRPHGTVIGGVILIAAALFPVTICVLSLQDYVKRRPKEALVPLELEREVSAS